MKSATIEDLKKLLPGLLRVPKLRDLKDMVNEDHWPVFQKYYNLIINDPQFTSSSSWRPFQQHLQRYIIQTLKSLKNDNIFSTHFSGSHHPSDWRCHSLQLVLSKAGADPVPIQAHDRSPGPCMVKSPLEGRYHN